MFYFPSIKAPNLCKMAGGMAERRWECLPANGTQKKGTCGTAPPPRRAAPHVILGEMDPRRSQARY